VIVLRWALPVHLLGLYQSGLLGSRFAQPAAENRLSCAWSSAPPQNTRLMQDILLLDTWIHGLPAAAASGGSMMALPVARVLAWALDALDDVAGGGGGAVAQVALLPVVVPEQGEAPEPAVMAAAWKGSRRRQLLQGVWADVATAIR
jgi:hypothetical protein